MATAQESMTRIRGGTFQMGSEDFYPEERPVHQVGSTTSRPAARQGETTDTSTSHIGFRCVVRAKEEKDF